MEKVDLFPQPARSDTDCVFVEPEPFEIQDPDLMNRYLEPGLCEQLLSSSEFPDEPFKYCESEIIEEIKQYIRSTYGEYYVGGQDKIQIQDLFHSVGISEEFARASIIKYASRFGKKNGRNRKDLLKLAHYAILLIHFVDDNDRKESLPED